MTVRRPSLSGAVRRAAVLAGLLGVLLTAACSTPPPPALRVMTWNVETHAHDPAEWAPVVAAAHPDVLALQEICTGEAFVLAAILRRDHGLDYAVVPGPVRPPTPAEAAAPVNAVLGPVCGTAPDDVQFGLAVLTRLPVADENVAVYPPDRRDEQRGFLTVHLGTAAGPLTVVTTHLGLSGVAGDQAARLARATADGGPTVVLGDLNLPPEAPELAPLSRQFTEVASGPTTDKKIDHVFLRGLTPLTTAATPDVTASDHRPVIVDLSRP